MHNPRRIIALMSDDERQRSIRRALNMHTEVASAHAPAKEKRKSIPKIIKDQVWDHYVGKEKGNILCFCCKKKEIRQSSFHAGHVIAVAKGGSTTVDNLRPICRSCNQSMGTMDMNSFIETYKPDAIYTKPSNIVTKREKIEEYKKDKNIVQIYRDMFSNICNPLSEYCIMARVDEEGNSIIPECDCGMKQTEIEQEAEKNLGTAATREQRVRFIIDNHLEHYFED